MARIKRGLVYIATGFCLLFLFRLAYGYLDPHGALMTYGQGNTGELPFEFSKRNYASEKFQAPSAAGKESYSVDQKYEKVGSLFSKTSHFDRDEGRLRDIVSQRHALIEYEQSAGLTGNRYLKLALGVVPAEFDALVAEVKQVGELNSISADKSDKTSEYRDLMAKKTSLETALNALQALKSRAGNVDQSINLEAKILEIEQNLQELGVQLGEYSQENEFCTVKFSLLETKGPVAISLAHRIRVALSWTITYYLLILLLLFLGSLLSLAGLTLAEKLKWITFSASGTIPPREGVAGP